MILINIISLKRRSDRRRSLIDHLYDMHCVYKFWDAVEQPGVQAYKNIIESHKNVVRHAKQRGLKCVLIAEDDFRFSCDKSLRYFIDTIPDDFDMYFGMIYSGFIQDNRITHGLCGLQFYMVHERFYETILSAPNNKHLDIWLGEQCHKYKYMVCDPFVVGAASGYSDNFKRDWTFDESLLPRKLLRQ